MQQSGDKWLEWRRQGIGASDCPIIMGVSPWKTPYQLWEEKLGLATSVGNFATQRGHDLEPKARASFELSMNEDFPPQLATHSAHPWLRASLDGFNQETNSVLEIKCPGKVDHEKAVLGVVPDKYWPQVQHQLLVTGASKLYYYSFDGESGATVLVEPDIEYIKDMFVKLERFWNLVVKKEPPAFTEKDQVKIVDSELVTLADQYAALDDQVKAVKLTMDALKEAIVKKLDHPKSKVGRLAITKSVTVGAVDYKKVPQLEGIDLEQYRKDPFPKVTIRVGKK